MRQVFELIRDTIVSWVESGGVLYAAALSFYAIFSMTPLVMLVIGMARLALDPLKAVESLLTTVEQLFGPDVALMIQQGLANNSGSISAGRSPSSLLATLVAIGLLLFGASIIFYGVQISLNAMWGIVPKKVDLRKNIWVVVQTRLLSAVAVLAVGLIFLVTMIVNAVWSALPSDFLQEWFIYSRIVIPVVSLIVSPLLYTVIFAFIFKTLPQARVSWRDVWLGAAVTALLFWLGGSIVWVSLGLGVISSVYGAASSLISFIIWIYYSAMIFLLGAKFTQLYADRYGTPIVPNEHASFISPPSAARSNSSSG
jgi:membrane protein